MSIWSSFAQIEPLRDGQYGADIVKDSCVDLADTGCRGRRGDLLRLCVDEGHSSEDSWGEARAVLDRSQVVELCARLTEWLERTA